MLRAPPNSPYHVTGRSRGLRRMTKHWQTPQPETAQRAARPRSIVFLGTAHDNGGSSILASSLAAAMRAEGHHVEEWYLFSAAPQDLPPGARVFIRHGRSRSPLMLSALFVRVVWALRKLKPDAVLVQARSSPAPQPSVVCNLLPSHHPFQCGEMVF